MLNTYCSMTNSKNKKIMLKYTNELFDSSGEGVIILDWRREF